MAECLQSVLNVTGYDSRDDQERERFIQYDPLRLASLPNKEDKRFLSYVRRQKNWANEHLNWTTKWGMDSIAPSAVSFHKVQPAVKMRRYEWLFYRRNNTTLVSMDCDNNDKHVSLSLQ